MFTGLNGFSGTILHSIKQIVKIVAFRIEKTAFYGSLTEKRYF
jgi:hypothetical protein